jgi:hypothetical protein
VGVSVTIGASLGVGVGTGALVCSAANDAPANRSPASAMVAPLMASVFFCMADTLFHPGSN